MAQAWRALPSPEAAEGSSGRIVKVSRKDQCLLQPRYENWSICWQVCTIVIITRNSASIHVLLICTEIHLIFLKWRGSVIPRKGPAKDPISSCVLAPLPRSAILYTGLDRPCLQLRLLNAPASWCFGDGEGDTLCTATCNLTSRGTSGLLPTSHQPGAWDRDRFPERSARTLLLATLMLPWKVFLSLLLIGVKSAWVR